ncbi:hypothetical protein Tco_0206223 [Tanacetum coccineum]
MYMQISAGSNDSSVTGKRKLTTNSKELKDNIEALNEELVIERQTRGAVEATLKHLRAEYIEADAKSQELKAKLAEGSCMHLVLFVIFTLIISLSFRLRDNIEELRRSMEPKENAIETLQQSLLEKEQDVRGDPDSGIGGHWRSSDSGMYKFILILRALAVFRFRRALAVFRFRHAFTKNGIACIYLEGPPHHDFSLMDILPGKSTSSHGRALALHARGTGFDSPHFHIIKFMWPLGEQ